LLHSVFKDTTTLYGAIILDASSPVVSIKINYRTLLC